MKSFKKLLYALALVVGVAVAPRLAFSATSPFTVTVGTVVPNGSVNGAAAYTTASYPNFTGTLQARKIVLSYTTTSSSAFAERVELWNTCTSSSTATLKWSGVIQSSGTNGGNGLVQVDIPPRLMPLTSPCFAKGTNDSNGTIKATLFYE